MSNAPFLVESLKDNGGKRTVTRAVFPPGAECPPHYHTEFEETFNVLDGEFTVYVSGAKHTLIKGQSSPKIKLNEIHYFKNCSQSDVVANIISEPGHAGGERVTNILIAMEKAGKGDLLTTAKGYNILWIVLYDMTNTLLVGLPKIIFTILRLIYGKDKIQKVRQDLLGQYGNEKL